MGNTVRNDLRMEDPFSFALSKDNENSTPIALICVLVGCPDV